MLDGHDWAQVGCQRLAIAQAKRHPCAGQEEGNCIASFNVIGALVLQSWTAWTAEDSQGHGWCELQEGPPADAKLDAQEQR